MCVILHRYIIMPAKNFGAHTYWVSEARYSITSMACSLHSAHSATNLIDLFQMTTSLFNSQ